MAESKEIQFTIDGRAVRARPGETVLSVAKRCGVRIPALCHHEAVAPYGVCRLCLVEVFWGSRSKLVTSCVYVPYEDDVVETNNERVRLARRMILELLLARCPEVEVVRELAREYGVSEARFPAPGGGALSQQCILCGLCVRVCDEVIGQSAIGYHSRGIKRAVTSPFGGRAEECIGCGACVFVCPTGALHLEDVDGLRMIKELNVQMPLVKCRVCGRFFATREVIARIRERFNLPDDVAQTCSVCRGVEFGGVMEKVLAKQR